MVQIQQFIELRSKDGPKLDRCFLIVWILSGLESFARLVCTYAYGSEEVFYIVFFPFNIQSYICLVVLSEFTIFTFWYLYFEKLYL